MGLRLFYGVNFSPGTVSAIGNIQNRLRPLVSRGNWCRPENFHITLHFIGKAEEAELPSFKAALEKSAEGIAPFYLDFDRYGHFRQRCGDLIYLRAQDRDGCLSRLALRIRENAGRGDSRMVKPHVTLVRKAQLPYARLKELEKERISLAPVQIHTVELMESRNVNGRPVYRSLHSVHLDKGKP